MLSVVQGIALYLRPSPFGVISEDFIDFFRPASALLRYRSSSFWLPRSRGDLWLYRTRSGLKLRAVGFREEAAKRNGVRVDFVHMRAYLLSAVIAVLGGLFVGSEVGVGAPVIGSELYVDQHRGRGSRRRGSDRRARLVRGRHVLGALFFTLTVNIITLLGLNTGAGIITSGALTLFAVAALFRPAADPPRLEECARRALRDRAAR